MNDTELIAQLHFITKQRRLRKALSNIASLPPPGELDSNSAIEITPSPERHTTFCRYINCPGDNTVEVTRCEACKQDVDHVQCSSDVENLQERHSLLSQQGIVTYAIIVGANLHLHAQSTERFTLHSLL